MLKRKVLTRTRWKCLPLGVPEPEQLSAPVESQGLRDTAEVNSSFLLEKT